MKKKLLVIGLIALLTAGIVGYLLYNKPHRNISKATSDYVVDAHTLFHDFEEDEAAANAKYLDKVVKVKGKLNTTETDDVGNVVLTLDAGDELFGVTCTVPVENAAEASGYTAGQQVTVKGVCTGKLMDVVLIRCVLEE